MSMILDASLLLYSKLNMVFDLINSFNYGIKT